MKSRNQYTMGMGKTYFAMRLELQLKEKGMSQVELARRAHIHKNFIGKYVRGESEPTVHKLIKICKELDISSDELIGLNKVKALTNKVMEALQNAKQNGYDMVGMSPEEIAIDMIDYDSSLEDEEFNDVVNILKNMFNSVIKEVKAS